MKKRQRLLFITARYGRGTGGLGVSAERIVGYLRSHYDVHILTQSIDPIEIACSESHAPGLHVTHFLPQRDAKLQLQTINDWVCAEIRREAVACVLGFYAGSWSYASLLAAHRYAIPFAGFARGNDIDLDLFGDGAFQTQYLLARANKTFCVTTELEHKIKGFSPEAHTQYIPNGIDPVSFPLLTRTTRTEDLVIGIFGDIKQKKGLAFLLEHLDFHAYQLRIVGAVRDDTAKLFHGFLNLHPDLTSRITHVPFVKSVPELISEYAKCDVICIPSAHEGMSNVMLEAMSCGKIVITSNIGGALDVIESGKNGFTFDLADPQMFKALLNQVSAMDLEAARRFGHAAHERVASRFNWELERVQYLEAIATLPSTARNKSQTASGYIHSTSRFSAPAEGTPV